MTLSETVLDSQFDFTNLTNERETREENALINTFIIQRNLLESIDFKNSLNKESISA